MTRFNLIAAIPAVTIAALLASTTAAQATPKNVILFIADDLGWVDLPYFSKPIQWPDGLPKDERIDAPDDPTKLHHLRRPDLNRLAARMFAECDASGNCVPGKASGVSFCEDRATPCASDADCPDPLNNPCVPIYPIEAHASFAYSTTNADCSDPENDPTTNCNNEVDRLPGAGGLARIVRTGTTYERFYSVTTKCEPARATTFSGRHALRLGVRDNGNNLAADEVTIAEYLRSGCASDPPSPCYNTGLFGKWHMGAKTKNAPWEQGFVEYMGFLGGSRDSWSTDPLVCSPRRVCDDTDTPCAADNECQNGVCTILQSSGLYVGPSSTPATCNDADLTNPNCCEPSGQNGKYSMKKKTTGYSKDGATVNGTTSWPCNDIDNAQCAYETRFLRNQALNFIKRHEADPDPFFLVVAYHAVHAAHKAPARTEAHYEASPRSSRPNPKFWAMLEEVDASVGAIVKYVADSPTLNSNTVVFFMSDHGAPNHRFGDPTQRGGKGNMYEGGARIGLIATGGEFGNLTDDTARGGFTTRLASQVDLFPTIADLAELAGTEAELQKPFGLCEATKAACMTNSDCHVCSGNADLACDTDADCASAGTCTGLRACTNVPEHGPTVQGKHLDGRSMIGICRKSSSTDPDDPCVTDSQCSSGKCLWEREFVFLEKKGGGTAIVTREKSNIASAKGVFGILPNQNEYGRVRGSSCKTCTADLEDPAYTTCKIHGGVCVAEAKLPYCKDPDNTVCAIGGDPRPCAHNSDCEGSTANKCATTVWATDCQECFEPEQTAWKVRGNAAKNFKPDSLFEIVSNQEEDEAINCCIGDDGETNCCEETSPVPAACTNWAFGSLMDELGDKHFAWGKCVSNADCDGDPCEQQTSGQAATMCGS